MAIHKKPGNTTFDAAKLQAMNEPLVVRVEKLKGNSSHNMGVPGKGDGAAPGTNWTRDDVLRLEDWILNEWSGGGFYRFAVVDANGERLEWQAAYDTRIYPERVPQSHAGAAQFSVQTQQPAPGAPMTVPPHALPLGSGGPSVWPPPSSTLAQPFIQPLPPGTPVQQLQQPMQQQVPPSQLPGPGPWNNMASWPLPGAPTPVLLGYHPQTGQPMYGPQPYGAYPYGASPYGAAPYGATPYGAAPYGAPAMTPLDPFGRRSRRDEEDERPSRWRYERERDEERRRREEEERHTREREEERKRYEDEIRQRDEEIRRQELSRREADYKATVERKEQQHQQELVGLREEIRRLGDTSRDHENDEVRKAREDRERMERERERERQEAVLRDLQQRSDTRFNEIQQNVGKVIEQINVVNSKPTDDPKLRQLELELQKQREDGQRQRDESARELDRHRSEQQHERERWERQRENEALQQRFKDQDARTERLLEEARTNRPDPMIAFMQENTRVAQENARTQSENIREIARMQQTSADRMTQMMMTPQAMLSMVKDASGGADLVIRNIAESYGSIFGTMKNAIEQIAQLQGPGQDPPAARLLQEGMGRVSELANQYLTVKQTQTQSEARVKEAEARANQAQAQAAAIAAQAAAQRQWQEAQQAQAQQAGVQFKTATGHVGPEVVAPGNGANRSAKTSVAEGLSGAQEAVPQTATSPAASGGKRPGVPKRKSEGPIDLDEGQKDAATGQTIAAADGAQVIPMRRPNMSEQELFGPALESVRRLRAGVKTFLDNLAKGEQAVLDKDGNPIGLTPDDAIDAVLKGVNFMMQNNLAAPAFDLFHQGRFADLIDLLIPDATQPYKDDCVRILSEEVEISGPGAAQDQEEPEPQPAT